MFYGGDNSVNNQKIYQYNAEGNNRFLPGLQPLTTESVEKEIFFQYGSIIVFSIPVIILLSSAKQNIQVMNILT